MGSPTFTNPRCSEIFPRRITMRSGQRKIRLGIQRCVGSLAGNEASITCGGNHSGVIGGKWTAGKENFHPSAPRLCFKAAAKLAVGGHASGNEDGSCRVLLGGSERARDQIIHD